MLSNYVSQYFKLLNQFLCHIISLYQNNISWQHYFISSDSFSNIAFCLGTSDPYCVVGLIKKEHQDIVASARDNLVDFCCQKGLDLESAQSKTIDNTINPNWNEEFEL